MARIHIFFLVIACWTILSCDSASKNHAAGQDNSDNTEEATWTSLMSMSAWHTYNRDTVHRGWILEDGVLYFDPSTGSRGDLVTNNSYQDFELSLEWKIDSCGNSGIMWGVSESPDLGAPYLTGPEMQILDDACHADGQIEKHRAGDLYDMISCSQVTVKPVGEWNEARIASKGGQVDFHLNGTKVVEFQMFGDEWENLVANSKFKDWPEFGKYPEGKIALQDHSDAVWFREIKIRKL